MNVGIVVASGRLDSTTADKLGIELGNLIDSGVGYIIIELVDVLYTSSSGLRELVLALKRLERGRGKLIVVTKDQSRDVIELAGLDEIMPNFDTLQEALASLA